MAEQKESKATEQEKALVVIRDLVGKAKDLKLMETANATGFSYFMGKKRICKLLNSKRGVSLEINVKLPDQFSKLPEMETISAALAHKKHLGTMKHMYRGSDAKQIGAIMAAALEIFRKEVKDSEEAAKKEEAKAQEKANKKALPAPATELPVAKEA